jgi:hypothetical protein
MLLYAVSEDPLCSDNNRVRIVLDNGWLTNPVLQAETAKIIRKSLRTISRSLRMKVVEAIETELDRLRKIPYLSGGQRSNSAIGAILSVIGESGVDSPEIIRLIEVLEEKERP